MPKNLAEEPTNAAIDADEDRQFWKRRSAGYNKLDWAKQSNYLDAFIAACEFEPENRVLDVGTGTGIIASRAAPLVRDVVGIDISPDMLEFARNEYPAENLTFNVGDVRSMDFAPESFDRVTARMVFHHVLTEADTGVKDVWRILNSDGMFILSEGVPPIREIGDWYTEMFAYKEDRRTFFEEDLVSLVGTAPFRDVTTYVHMVRQASIRNWLENGAVSAENQSKIWEMHRTLEQRGKDAYNMVETDDDIFIDMKFVIVVARK